MILLDGHHKALAAAVDSQDVNALVIMPGTLVHRWQQGGQGNNVSVGYQMGDMSFSCKDLQLTKSDQKKLEAKRLLWDLSGGGISEANQVKQLQQEMAFQNSDDALPFNTKELANVYPLVADQAEIDRVGVIDDQRLDDILNGIVTCDDEDICHLMSALC